MVPRARVAQYFDLLGVQVFLSIYLAKIVEVLYLVSENDKIMQMNCKSKESRVKTASCARGGVTPTVPPKRES